MEDPSLDIRAWYEPRDGSERRVDVSSVDVRRRRARRDRQRDRRALAAAPASTSSGIEQFELGHAAARRTTTRGSSGARTTRPATSSSPARRTTPGPASSEPTSRWSSAPAGSTCSPPDPAIPIDDYTRSMDAVGVAVRGARRGRDHASAGRSSRCPAGRSGCTRPTPGSSPPSAAPPRCGAARSPRRRLRDALAGAGDPRPGRRPASRSRPTAGRSAPAASSSAADAWTNELLAGLDCQIPLDRHPGAARPTRAGAAGVLRPGPVPGLDLDGRADLVRLPEFGEPTGQDRPGLRRPRRRPRRPDLRSRPGDAGAAARLPGPHAAPASATRADAALPLHADPGPRLRARAGARATPTSSSRSARRTASSSRRSSAGCSPTCVATGETATDLAPFRLDRPALTEPDYPAHWLV